MRRVRSEIENLVVGLSMLRNDILYNEYGGLLFFFYHR